MDHFIDSLSNSLSKEFGAERNTISDAYFGDLKKRPPGSISTERIDKKVPLLGTYVVKSDAIPGGMGSVWKVHHTGWNTDLAMKRPHPVFFAEAGEEKKKRFVEECENWINLGLHPNIVSCYYVREIGGVPTIFSEWMDGGSLKDRIADGTLYIGSKNEVQERILNIAIQSARGLQYSHQNKLIHQDIKPGNLLLTKSWDAKVADFGLAKARSGLTGDDNKTSGCTPEYCPKEQTEGAAPAPWMDYYAWALTVLAMYAGQRYAVEKRGERERLWNTGAEAKEHFFEYPQKCEHSIPLRMLFLIKACLNSNSENFLSSEKLIQELLNIYQLTTGKAFPIDLIKSFETPSGSYNNWALSMLELGKEAEAEQLWKKAVEADRYDAESNYNYNLHRWRKSEISDEKAIADIKSCGNSELVSKLMSQIKTEAIVSSHELSVIDPNIGKRGSITQMEYAEKKRAAYRFV